MKKFIKKILNNLFQNFFDNKLIIQSKILSNINNKKKKILNLAEVEFKVFSQWGEDGVIEWLVSKIPKIPKIFLEIGTEDYVESNTRYLIQNRNWHGFLIEANKNDVERIKKQKIYWKHQITISNSFINKTNINKELEKMKIPKKIGLLSIDIDSVDYWVLKEINKVEPVIIICEYNPIFGTKEEITVNYKENFIRSNIHYSNLFYGASIKAFINLLKPKGYTFLGTNSAGNNAFFVKKKYSKNILKILKNIKIFQSNFRESRNTKGYLTFLSKKNSLKLIEDKIIYDLKDKKEKKLKNLSL